MTDYLKQVKAELERADFEFARHGKGSHDVWRNTKTGKSIPLPKKIPSRDFANRILKEAGINKRFS
jgi:predicted RNA binding protein YcfA (HicA-like mRNA interferase family)